MPVLVINRELQVATLWQSWYSDCCSLHIGLQVTKWLFLCLRLLSIDEDVDEDEHFTTTSIQSQQPTKYLRMNSSTEDENLLPCLLDKPTWLRKRKHLLSPLHLPLLQRWGIQYQWHQIPPTFSIGINFIQRWIWISCCIQCNILSKLTLNRWKHRTTQAQECGNHFCLIKPSAIHSSINSVSYEAVINPYKALFSSLSFTDILHVDKWTFKLNAIYLVQIKVGFFRIIEPSWLSALIKKWEKSKFIW